MAFKKIFPVCSSSIQPLNKIFHRGKVLTVMMSNLSMFAFMDPTLFPCLTTDSLPCPKCRRFSKRLEFYLLYGKLWSVVKSFSYKMWDLGQDPHFLSPIYFSNTACCFWNTQGERFISYALKQSSAPLFEGGRSQ